MSRVARSVLIWCAGILAVLGLVAGSRMFFSEPRKSPVHKFDSFRKDPEACISAFNGRDASFSHVWVLRSPDLKDWWSPNGLRAEADLVLDSDEPEVLRSLLSCSSSSSDSPNHVRTLPDGRIYHVLLFDASRQTYAHLRFSYRSKQSDGSTVFRLVTDYGGANPVKDCPAFLEFEKRWLGIAADEPAG